MSRKLLHKTRLEPFKVWLTSQGIQHRTPRGTYEALQVQARPPAWFCIFDRHTSPEHYTVDARMEPLVRRFIQETRTES